MLKAGKVQQDIANMRSKGLTLAQANLFANRKKRTPVPMPLVVAIAGVVLMGTGVAAVFQERLSSDPTLTADLAPSPAPQEQAAPVSAPAPTVEPTVSVTAPTPEWTAPAETVVITQDKTLAPPETTTLKTVAFEEAQQPQEVAPAPSPVPDIAQPDCVQNLRDVASDLVLTFASGSTVPNPFDVESLVELGSGTQACPEARVVIAGHSDATGADVLNLQLSWQRADATLGLLSEYGLDTSQFEPIGFGSRQPVAEGSSDDDEANRRVEFRVQRAETGG